jgi:hypothetical protein
MARSARKASGISKGPLGMSMTAREAASLRSDRTSEMIRRGCNERGAWTRLVRRMTNMPRVGSIHIDVPVNPVWP